MACSCSHYKRSRITDDVPFENEENSLCRGNCDDEQENTEDDILSSDENTCGDLIFVDGNDEDLEVCEYEDTLMERVWWSSKPPKIPKRVCVVPARRIQVMKERLSPTLKGLPTPREALGDEVNKNGKKRQKIKSDVNYVVVNNFNEHEKTSCQTKTVTIVPDCARRLEDLL